MIRLSDEDVRMRYLYFTASFYTTLLLLAVVGQRAQATPLLQTDDAAIVDVGHCQIELDQKFSHDNITQANITPACNLANIEFGLPLSWDEGEERYAFQVKKQFFHAEKVPVAVAASVTFQPKQDHEATLWQLNVPTSYYVNDRLQIDANVGVDHQDHNDDLTWGVASTYSFKNQGVSLELYKMDAEKTRGQVVYHYHVVPDQLALYASYGQALNSSDHSWLGLGLSWVTARGKK